MLCELQPNSSLQMAANAAPPTSVQRIYRENNVIGQEAWLISYVVSASEILDPLKVRHGPWLFYMIKYPMRLKISRFFFLHSFGM